MTQEAAAAPLLYLDTSALVRLYSAELGREDVLREQAACSGVVVHDITYLELRAALSSRLRRKLMRPSGYAQALGAFEADWPTIAHIGVTEKLIREGGNLAERHTLRAFDALHLASALSLSVLDIRFMTFDKQLHAAAEVELPGQVCPLPENF